MRTTLFSIILVLLLASCGSKNGNAANESQSQDAEPVNTVEQVCTTDDVADNDERICTAIQNYLLGKSGAAVLAASAKQDLTESTWPEVQCSVEGTLDSPRSFKDLTVKKVGEGQYKYSCVCPDHGDKYTDSCTIHATLGSDGTVRIEHITWDDANNVQSITDLLQGARWYDTECGFKLPNFMTPTTEIYVDEVSASVLRWVYDDICFACWPLLGVWAVDDYPAPGHYLTEDVLVKSVTYHNGAGTVFSGYATDGRVWYMKKRIMDGGEVAHAKILALLYPKDKQNEVKTFVDIVKKW